MKNTFIARIFYGMIDTRRIVEDPEKDFTEEVIKDEYRIDYEPGDPISANRAIDHIIEKVIRSKEEFPKYAIHFGYEWESTRIELIVAREDKTVISNVVINNSKEVELFDSIYKFLRDNFYFV